MNRKKFNRNVENSKGAEILPNLQANKLVNQGLMDKGKRYEISGPEIMDNLLPTTISITWVFQSPIFIRAQKGKLKFEEHKSYIMINKQNSPFSGS